MNLHLDWCSTAAARYACEHWHYAKRYSVTKTAKIGVWEDGKFIGVVVFSSGTAGVGKIYINLGLPEFSVAELQRVALTTHRTPVTRILAIALRMLKRYAPGLELVISYADPSAGHTGQIYHAGNWYSWGMSAKDKAYEFAGGVRMHSRSVSESGYKSQFHRKGRARRTSEAIRIVDLPPKYRFLYPLGPRGRAVIEILRAKQATAPIPSAPRRGSTDPHAPKDIHASEAAA